MSERTSDETSDTPGRINGGASEVGGYTFGMRTEVLPSEEEQARRAALRDTRDLPTLDPDDLDVLDRGLFHHRPDGRVLVQVGKHEALMRGQREGACVVFEGKPLSPRFLVRSDRWPSIADLRAWEAEREGAAERGRRERAERLAEQRKRARPVLLTDLDQHAPASLRDALERLDALGGSCRVADGRLVVEAPEETLGGIPGFPSEKPGVRLARVLYACETALVAAAGRGGKIDAAKIPDGPLLPSGAVLPS